MIRWHHGRDGRVLNSAERASMAVSAGGLGSLVGQDGSDSLAHVQRLCGYQSPMIDLADAVHGICAVHGAHPGIIDHALARDTGSPAAEWLARAATGFAVERTYIAALTASVGPLPSTPGQAETEAALVTQRHALDMLACSDRIGVSLGAAVALVLDWPAIRTLLDHAAERSGIACEAMLLPRPAATNVMLGALALTPAIDRAMKFGTQQVLAQHRALWQLLEARAEARGTR